MAAEAEAEGQRPKAKKFANCDLFAIFAVTLMRYEALQSHIRSGICPMQQPLQSPMLMLGPRQSVVCILQIPTTHF
jgi:hypothetical protein